MRPTVPVHSPVRVRGPRALVICFPTYLGPLLVKVLVVWPAGLMHQWFAQETAMQHALLSPQGQRDREGGNEHVQTPFSHKRQYVMGFATLAFRVSPTATHSGTMTGSLPIV